MGGFYRETSADSGATILTSNLKNPDFPAFKTFYRMRGELARNILVIWTIRLLGPIINLPPLGI